VGQPELIERLLEFLQKLVEPLRFIKRARERRRQEKETEREFMVDLVDTVLARVEKIAEHQKDQGIAQSQSAQKLAEAIGTWLDMFKHANEAYANVASATVRPEDEFEAENQREQERLKAKGFPVDAPDAQKLAWLLENDEL
jgi:hypothetical protein